MSAPMAATLPPPVADGLFRVDGERLVLVGGHSPSSGLSHFPLQPLCPYTGADDVEEVELPRTGRLWLATSVNAAPPGYHDRIPFGLGIAELDGGLRVLGRLVDTGGGEPVAGDAVAVVPEVVADEERQRFTTWAFARDPGAS